MAQTQRRMLYSKIWTSQQFGKLDPKEKLLYIGTITLADDDGRLVGDASYLRGQIFPYDEELSVKEVLSMRNKVETMGLVEVYKVGMFEYIQHPKWEEYQAIRGDLYKPSSLPDRNGKVTKPLLKSSLSKDKISKDKISKNTIPFDSFWSIYPKKTGKKKCEEMWGKLDRETQNKILADIPLRMKDSKWVGGFIKDPERYLKNEQWNDEIIASATITNKTHRI